MFLELVGISRDFGGLRDVSGIKVKKHFQKLKGLSMDLMGFRGYSEEFPRYPSLSSEIHDSTNPTIFLQMTNISDIQQISNIPRYPFKPS